MSDIHDHLEPRRTSSALTLLVAVLFVAPVAMAQAPAGSGAQPSNTAPTQSQAAPVKQAASSAPSATQTQAGASSQTEPQMQDQSAPAAESLGEAARKARTQKTKAAAPKVYTEDSVSHLSGHGVSVVGDGNTGSGGAPSDTENSGTNPNPTSSSDSQPAAGGQEQYWRGRARTIRDQMAQLDQQIAGIRDEIAKYGAVQVDPQSGAQAGIIYIKDRNEQISRIETQKAGLQSQMDALEDEGRKAGADSGWFR
jgi:hypothetical protein